MHFPEQIQRGKLSSPMKSMGQIGSFRSLTMGLASKMASLRNRKPALAAASSRHSRKVSTPKSKLSRELGELLYRSLTRRSQKPSAEPHLRESTWFGHIGDAWSTSDFDQSSDLTS